jgi:hypothetical protein
MDIYYIQKFWYGEHYYTDTTVHKDYFTIQLPKVNVDAQIWLTILGPGINFDEGVVGLAAAGVKSYRYVDSNGVTQYQELSNWESHLRISNCVEITFSFAVQLAWAKAEGIIYWHT